VGTENQHIPSDVDVRFLDLLREHVQQLWVEAAGAIHLIDSPLVLEVAPQNHGGITPLLNADARVITLDIDPESHADIIGDLCAINPEIESGSIDVVICTEVIEHVSNPFDAAEEIFRVLKPGGTAYLSAPFNFRIHGPLPDNWRFSEHGWRELLKRFDHVSIEPLETPDRPLMPIHYNVVARKKP
jgi:SAM-dependent methyltransferase